MEEVKESNNQAVQDIEVKEPKQEPGLANIMKLAEPLLAMYLQTENEKHRHELEYDNNLLKETSKQSIIITIGAFAILIIVFIIVGILLSTERDALALDLLKLIVALGGAAFGGYGWATRKRIMEENG